VSVGEQVAAHSAAFFAGTVVGITAGGLAVALASLLLGPWLRVLVERNRARAARSAARP